jgi:hypothetical protein
MNENWKNFDDDDSCLKDGEVICIDYNPALADGTCPTNGDSSGSAAALFFGDDIARLDALPRLMLILGLITVYTIVDSIMETKHPRFGHATGVVLVLGGIISLGVYYSETHDLQAFLTIKILFSFLLPFILMNEGYNMHRKKFFS